MKDFDVIRKGRDMRLLYEEFFDDWCKLPEGLPIKVTVNRITEKRERSNTQLNLYWACCKFLAENTDDENWNTKYKVDEQVKIKMKHYEYYVYYHNEKTGQATLHIKTKSISFRELSHLEACGFFTGAFEILAARLGMTVDEMVDEAKLRMGLRYGV